ncbi:hypothetical protein [Rhizobium freirei]|uniref:hypothetical protein n=1 Tax=Rhizobium freirei TaxID=1353277 RepID=UPI00055F45AE|nr:hypothetical protein [Rhizobium freirei]
MRSAAATPVFRGQSATKPARPHIRKIKQASLRLLLESFRTVKNVVTVDVNAQNPEAIGFYEGLGFKVTSRSELNDQGRPYPILRLHWERSTSK